MLLTNPQLLWPFLLAVCAAAVDLRRREIPDAIPLLLLLTAPVAFLGGWLDGPWWNPLLAIGLTLVLTLPGFARGLLGGGDVKLLVGLAAWFGLAGTVGLLFWTAVLGALCSLAAAVRGRTTIAYAPAIALATLIQVLAPQSLPLLARGLAQLGA